MTGKVLHFSAHPTSLLMIILCKHIPVPSKNWVQKPGEGDVIFLMRSNCRCFVIFYIIHELEEKFFHKEKHHQGQTAEGGLLRVLDN